ncbi:MAG: GntR family transcriptional regulator [Planctomycetota bacterium]
MAPTAANFDAASGSVTRGLADELRHRVIRGTFKRGESMPSERLLADDFAVSRDTVRSALQQLEREGLISTSGRRRTVVGIRRASMGINSQTVMVLSVSRPDRVLRQPSPGWAVHFENGAIDAIRSNRHNALVVAVESFEDPRHLDEVLLNPPRGIVVSSEAHSRECERSVLDRLSCAGIAIVTEGHPDGTEDFDRVCSDHVAGARALTHFLQKIGSRQIVHLLPDEPSHQYWTTSREAGHTQAMRDAHLEPRPTRWLGEIKRHLFAGYREFEAATMQMIGYLHEERRQHGEFDAIMCPSDGYVPIAAAACRKLGFEPQRDVAIVGYDHYWANIQARQWESTAPLATIDKQDYEIGRRMVTLLERRLAGQTPATPASETMPVSLIDCRQQTWLDVLPGTSMFDRSS